MIASAPTSGSTAIGTNAVIGLTFNENVDQNTVDPSNVTLTGPSGNIPLTASYNPSNFSMTVTPQAPLPPGSTLTLTLNGITDNDGNTLNPTPYTLMFTTGPAPDYAAPVLLTTNVTYGQTGVPVTTSFSMIFNKPIDWRSVVYPSGVYLYDYSSGYIPATVSPIGSNGILITPTSLLPVDHNFYYYACISDLNGNSGCSGSTYFTTAISSPSGGPQVTQMIPPPATTLIAVNFQPMVQFDRPVNPRFLSGATLTQGGSAVQATPVLSSGGTVLTLVPASLLLPNQPYQFSVSGMQDSAGNGMAGSVSRSFTTGSGIDLTTPQVVSSTPINGASVGTNPVLEVTFNKPINPIQSASFSLSTYLPGLGSQGAPGAALSWASDFKSVQFTYPGALNPNVNYYWSLSFTDLYGNYGNYFNGNFQTGSGADTSPETVTSVTPPSGIAGVPLNAVISIRLVKPAAPVSVTNASLTLSPAVSGSQVQLSSDGYTLTVSYSGQLAPSTLYTISVPAGG